MSASSSTVLICVLAFLGQCAALLHIGQRAGALAPPDRPWARLFMGLFVAVASLEITLQALGFATVLSTGALLAALAVEALLWEAWYRRGAPPPAPSNWPRPSWRSALVVGAIVSAWVILSLGAYSNDNDTGRYHIILAAHWLATGNLWSIPFSEPGSYLGVSPGNAELIATWLMYPLGDDRMAYLGSVLGLVLMALGGAALAEARGRPVGPWYLALLATILTPLYLQTEVHTLQVDGLLSAELIAAAAFAVMGHEQPQQWRWPVLFGVALGLALGTKIVTIPDVAIMGVGGAWLMGLRPGRLSLEVLFMVVAGGGWYLRNAFLLHGQPLPLGGSGVVVPAAIAADRASLVTVLLHGHGSQLTATAGGLVQRLGPAAVLLVVGLIAAVRRGDRITRLLAVMVAVMALVYPFLPYTGGTNTPEGLTLIAGAARYIIPAIMLGAVVAGMVLPQRSVLLIGFVGVAFTAASVSLPALGQPLPSDAIPGWGQVLAIVIATPLLATLLIWTAPQVPGRLSLLAAAVTVAVAAALLPAPRDAAPLRRALAAAGGTHARFLLANVWDARAALGGDLRRPLSGVGPGAPGLQVPEPSAAAFDAYVSARMPCVVIIGLRTEPGIADSLPGGWTAPIDWRLMGVLDHADVYVVVSPNRSGVSPSS